MPRRRAGAFRGRAAATSGPLVLGIRPSMSGLPAKVAAGFIALALFAAPSLLEAPPARAAAYYVGGGKGVRLAVRVVDHQVVWTRMQVLNRCVASDRGHYHYIESSEGLAGQVAIGRRGRFGWRSRDRTVGEDGDESTNGKSLSGRVGPTRLVGRFVSYGWFTSSEPAGTHSHGRCRSGSGPRPPVFPVPVPIMAHRRPEPPGLAFYFAGRREGITAYFEVRRRRILRAEVAAVRYCTGPDGGRYYNDEASAWHAPIRIGPSGAFHVYEPPDEIRPLEILRGQFGSSLITGSYGYAHSDEEGGHCRTGSFKPGHDRTWAVPFVAPRR
jgi:hypothetical protein